MSLVLFIVAFILVVGFTPIGMVFTTIKSICYWNQGILKSYFWRLAISLDQLGNVALGGLFNVILISNSSIHAFGNPDETISSVLGKNKKAGTLIYLGIKLDSLLERLDKNHTIKSIEQ